MEATLFVRFLSKIKEAANICLAREFVGFFRKIDRWNLLFLVGNLGLELRTCINLATRVFEQYRKRGWRKCNEDIEMIRWIEWSLRYFLLQ